MRRTPKDRLMTTDEAAEYLGIQPNTLEIWRSTKRYNLKYIKVGGAVRYRFSDLEEFLNRRTEECGDGQD